MSQEVVNFPKLASPTLDEVFEQFLADQRARLKPRAIRQAETVVHLLRQHLNGYAYTTLSDPEQALFDRHYKAEGEAHREFCQLFGPDKIVQHLGGFLGYFMIRKVLAGTELKKAAGTVTKKLTKWLAEKGYASPEAARGGGERAARAAKELPAAEQAAQIIFDDADRLPVDASDLEDENYMEFDHYTIGRLEPGKLWLETYEGGVKALLGPIPVPKMATALIREGWDISCGLGRVRGKWRILEMGNFYPG